jgi:hypothetical protein
MHIVDPGTIQNLITNETIMSYHLDRGLIAKPEILPQMFTLPSIAEQAPFISMLVKAGNVLKGLGPNAITSNYKVVGNRKVMAAIKGDDRRKGIIMSAVYANTTKPGYNSEVIELHIDTNFFAPYDVCGLADGRTMLTNVNDLLADQDADGYYVYKFRLNRESKTEYVNPSLLEAGMEIDWKYNNQYEMSETGYEKYTGDTWAWTWLTIQRLAFSISGTAQAMKTDKIWMLNNGVPSFVTQMEMKMMKDWAKMLDQHALFGKGTVDANDNILLSDLKGRDIVAGSGVVNQGDGSLKYPSPGQINMGFIEKILENLQMYSNSEGVVEVGVVAGWHFMNQFSKLMKDWIKYDPNSLVQGTGAEKGINATFSFFELNGIRIRPIWKKDFNDPNVANFRLKDGTLASSHRAVFVSLGNNSLNDKPNVSFVQLGDRGMKKGSVDGINVGGDRMSTSVDGTHTHILTESGPLLLDPYGIAEVYVPVSYKS